MQKHCGAVNLPDLLSVQNQEERSSLETISVIQSDPCKAGRPLLKNDPGCVRASRGRKAAHSITERDWRD